MGDVASPNALYPAAPQPNQGMLSGDPSKIIGIIGALNQNKLFNAQYPALAQQPDAALAGQNIANQSSQMKQNEEGAQIVAHHFGTLPDNATPEDLYRMKAAIRAIHPNIPASTINTVADVALRDPKGLRQGINTLRTMGVSPAEMVGRVAGPPTVEGAPTQQPLTSAIRAGATQTGLSPKETAAQGTSGATSAEAANKERVRSLNYNQEVFGLETAIPALERLGTKGTGPGAETINHIKSFLLTNVPGVKESDFDGSVKDIDVAKKYLTDFARQNGDSGTNDKLAALFASNPSVNISNAAAQSVAKSALTLRRFQQARQVAFDTSGKDDQDFPKEAAKWAREHDVRAYGFDLMSADQRKKTLESLPAGKREMFMMDVQDALKNGIVKAPK